MWTNKLLPAIGLLLTLSGLVWAQTTGFTYQGKLSDASIPATGTYDFTFRLFDASSGGAQIGSDLLLNDIAVANGIFTVNLDFGASAFADGLPRYLEISVRPGASSGAFTLLAPRQTVTSAPFALRSLSAASADTATNAQQLGGTAADQFVQTSDSRLTDDRHPLPNSAHYIQNGTSQQASANFNVSGTGTADIFNAATQYNINGARAFTQDALQNTIAGFTAGNALTTGDFNSFFGGQAGYHNSTGARNAFFGYHAGFSNTTGFNNVFIGHTAANFTTTGSENNFIGYGAGFKNTTGGQNAYYGSLAGFSGLTATNNNFYGYYAGRLNTANENNFFGSYAGEQNTTGVRNSYFGHQAGTANVTGTDNNFFGYYAGRSNAASGNNFFGSYAGASNTTGTRNNFFGYSAGMLGAGGNDNSFFGYQTGVVNTANENNFFGSYAGGANTTGSGNSFFGSYAGAQNTTGAYNSLFGSYAGNRLTTSHYSSFFGFRAGEYTTTGDANSYFGYLAGEANTTGASNSLFGYLVGSTLSTGSGNTIIGWVGGFNLTTGSYNTGIGYYTGFNNSISNATAIGANAYVAQSNSMVLGSIVGIHDGAADTRVAIGTVAPTFRFHVKAGSQDGIKIQNGGGDYQQIRWTNSADATTALISVGPVGSEDMRFYVNGADRLIVENSGTVVINTLGAAGATALCRNASNQIASCSSSLRYKTNINEFRAGLSVIKRLRPITFNWKQGGMADVGLGAEEVAQVDELLVTRNERGEVEGVKYDRIGVVLVNAVKEQQAQIEAQQAELETQRARLEVQQKQNDDLRQQLAAQNSRNAVQQQQIDAQNEQLKRQQAELDALKAVVCAQNPQLKLCPSNK